MQPSTPALSANSVPEGLSLAARVLGHRPAISLLLSEGRQEQSYASIAQWTAKTAHWLQIDHGVQSDASLGIVGSSGWVPAVAALGAWWLGLRVAIGSGAERADVVIAGPDVDHADAPSAFRWGHAFDGSDEVAGGEMFAWVVQEFPDTPPPALGGADTLALTAAAAEATQREMISVWRDSTGTLGVDSTVVGWLSAAAVRPLVTGRPTVLLGPGVERDAAAGDRVARWL